jgi:DNA polymerase-3 subunit delta'
VTLPALRGHGELRASLARAVASGTLPGSLLLHGPPGSGKQRFALWLAQLMLCRTPTSEGPCGACRSCLQAVRLEHPDIHWFFPLPRPKGASSPERLAGALEDLRGDALAELRETPLRVDTDPEPRGIYLAAVQTLRRKALQRPSVSERQVFVVGHAEELVPQESAPEAANALLKLLEEPPPSTVFILTSSRFGRVLPTIRSRAIPLHVPSLPAEEVARFLVEEAGVDEELARKSAALSGGCIGRALGFLPVDGEDGPFERTRKEAFHLFRACLDPSDDGAFALALGFPSSKARALIPLLDAVEVWVRDAALVSEGRADAVVNPEAVRFLQRTLQARRVHGVAFSEWVAEVEEARIEAAGNVNPQLIVHGLVRRSRERLRAWTLEETGATS